jgi:hypothetical protein
MDAEASQVGIVGENLGDITSYFYEPLANPANDRMRVRTI